MGAEERDAKKVYFCQEPRGAKSSVCRKPLKGLPISHLGFCLYAVTAFCFLLSCQNRMQPNPVCKRKTENSTMSSGFIDNKIPLSTEIFLLSNNNTVVCAPHTVYTRSEGGHAGSWSQTRRYRK